MSIFYVSIFLLCGGLSPPIISGCSFWLICCSWTIWSGLSLTASKSSESSASESLLEICESSFPGMRGRQECWLADLLSAYYGTKLEENFGLELTKFTFNCQKLALTPEEDSSLRSRLDLLGRPKGFLLNGFSVTRRSGFLKSLSPLSCTRTDSVLLRAGLPSLGRTIGELLVRSSS